MKVALGVLLLGVLDPGQAEASAEALSAPESGQAACINSHFEAQRLRKAALLLESREALNACLDELCPSLLREECGTWLNEINSELPRVVVAIVDEQGKDILNYTLTIDDRPAKALAGSPEELNPGKHRIKAVAQGFDSSLQEIELHSGERLRKVSLVLQGQPRDAVPLEPRRDSRATAEKVHWPGYAFAGASLAFFGASIALGVTARSDETIYRSGCLPTCNGSLVDDLALRYTLTNVGLALGAASALGSAAWFIWAPLKSPQRQLEIRSSPAGATLEWTSHF